MDLRELLVAEGAPGDRRRIELALRERGYGVVVATTVEEAIGEIRRGLLDLAILDLRLPTAGGIEAMRRIREMAPDLAVILTSACPFSCEGFQVWSADACVVKSGNLGELLKSVGQLARNPPSVVR